MEFYTLRPSRADLGTLPLRRVFPAAIRASARPAIFFAPSGTRFIPLGEATTDGLTFLTFVNMGGLAWPATFIVAARRDSADPDKSTIAADAPNAFATHSHITSRFE